MNRKLLIIGHVWPEPKSSAAGSRMMQLINLFLKKNYSIVFATACSKSEKAFDLSTLGVHQETIEMNHSSFDDFVKNLNPDVVVFDRFITEEQFGWRVAEQCPGTLRILDTEDLHCLRKGRQQAFKDGKIFDTSYLFNAIAKREIASVFRCDLTLIISEVELQILRDQFQVPEYLLYYLPFQMDLLSEKALATFPNFEQRHHFMAIGNFLHEPNYNAILYLKETVWPLIKKSLPKAELHIYGAYATQKVNQLHNENEGFLIKGFAENVHDVMSNARVCLAPLRFGAGLKGKLIDAMIDGTPSVMTTIAAEGMFGNMEPNGFIEDQPDKFAEKAVTLHQNEGIWKEKQANGFKIINQRFNKKLFNDHFETKIQEIFEGLQEHRQRNFIGQMLQHHQLQSTKFMSKWIEEKNK